MQNLKSFIKKVFIYLTLSTSSFAGIPETDVVGFHPYLKAQYAYLSPIHGVILLNTNLLSNMRFLGNYGKETSQFKCHPQITPQAGDTNNPRERDCPQDAIATLIQYFFPSPAGDRLTANQSGDLVSHLNARTLGLILEFLTIERSQNTQKDVENLARKIFKNQFSKNFEGAFNQAKTQQVGKQKKSGPSEEEKRITSISQKLRSNSILDDEKAQLKTELANLRKQLKQKKLLQETQETAPSDFDEEKVWALIVDPKNRNLAGKYQNCLEIAQIIIDAHDASHQEGNGYPDYLVEHSILAFAFKKAKSQENIFTLVESFGPSILQHIPTVEEIKKTTINDIKNIYDSWKSSFKDGKPSQDLLKELVHNPELFFFFSIGYDLFDNSFPPNIGFADTFFPSPQPHENLNENDKDQRKYSDCGETALRNFLNVLLYSYNDKQNFNVELLTTVAPKAQKNLITFYQNQNATNLEEMRNVWSDVVSNIEDPNITYAKKSQFGRFDLDADITNLLNVLTYLLNDEQLNEIEDSSQTQREKDAAKLTRICAMFSRPDLQITWQVKDQNNQQLPSGKVTIEILINGDINFEWAAAHGHTDFLESAKRSSKVRDWRKDIGLLVASVLNQEKSDYGNTNFLTFYETPHNAPSLLKDYPQALPSLVYGLPLKQGSELISAICLVLSTPSSPTLLNILEKRWSTMIVDDPVITTHLFSYLAYYPSITRFSHLSTWFERAKRKIQNNSEVFAFIAAEHGYINLINWLMSNGQDVSSIQNSLSQNLLHVALINNQHDVARFLIDKEPDLALQRTRERITALHLAAEKGYLDLIKILAEKTDILQEPQIMKGSNGQTPLHLAAFAGHLDVVQWLVNNAPDFLDESLALDDNGQTPLHYAARSGQIAIIKFLISKSSDLLGEWFKDKQENTPLDLAIENGQLSTIKFFLAQNSSLINTVQVKSLLEAIRNNQTNVLAYLIQLKPDFLRDEVNDKTLLEIACMNNRGISGAETLVKLMSTDDLEGIISTCAKHERDNPLFMALNLGPEAGDLIKMLINKVSPKLLLIPDDQGNTLLHRAAENNLKDIADLLLSKNPNFLEMPYLKNNSRNTALQTAISYGALDVVTLFLNIPNARDIFLQKENLASGSSQASLLHLAAQQGNIDIVRVLLSNPAARIQLLKDENYKDKRGRTPADYTRNQEIKTLIQENKAEFDKQSQTSTS